jgi:hypothetical protein
MIYTIEELNRISGSRLAVNGRIYLDNKGNKYKGTVNGRIEQINISDRNVNIKLEVDDTPQSLRNFLINLKNFTESSIELLKNLLSNKQDKLISGENIKTINSESLLGSGNIVISGSSYDGDPTIIVQDSDHRFVTDTEKSTWNGKQNSLGFTPENITNKETSGLDTSTTKYPCNNVVKAAVDAKLNIPTGTPDGTKYLRDDNTWQSVSGGSGLTQEQIEGLI